MHTSISSKPCDRFDGDTLVQHSVFLYETPDRYHVVFTDGDALTMASKFEADGTVPADAALVELVPV